MKSRAKFAVAVLGVALVSLALLPLSAVASQLHLFKETFGSAGKPAFSSANGLAVDQSTGDLLVIDSGAKTISRWNPNGTPANFSALGTNVIDAKQGAGNKACAEEPASCDKTPQNSLSFDSGVGEQQVTVDNSGTATDGDIYLTQSKQAAGNLVDIFASSGEYLGQITEGGGTAFGQDPTAHFGPCGVAVDPSGALFLAGGFDNKIYKYASQGAPHNPLNNLDYVKTFTGTSESCNLAAGAGSSAGFLFVNKFFKFEGNSVVRLDIATGTLEVVDEHEDRLVSVDPATGHLYAAEFKGENGPDLHGEGAIREFDATTSPAHLVSSFHQGQSAPPGIAVSGATGDIYLGRSFSVEVYGPRVTVPEATTGPATITGDNAATLTGTVDPDGVALEACTFEWGKPKSSIEPYEHAEPCAESPAAIGVGHGPVAVHLDLAGLAGETTYQYRLRATNHNSALYPNDPLATASGLDREFKTPSKPAIKAAWTASVGLDEATLQATINPENSETSFRFEWGKTAAYGEVTAEEAVAVGIDAEDHTVSVTLHGLAPGSTYHYRVLAQNGIGAASPAPDREFHTYLPDPSEMGCPNEALRIGAAALLHDCRAYELVSPLAKGGAEVGVPGSRLSAGGGGQNVQPRQASPSGEAVTYGSWTAFGDDPESAPATSQYLSSRRGDGWSTDNINPRSEGGGLRDPFAGFSPDLSHAAAIVIEPELTPDAAKDVPDLYQRDNSSGILTAITTKDHQPETSLPPNVDYCVAYGGASADSKRVFFAAKGALIEGDPAADGFNLYEWSALRPSAQRLRLVSVLPNELAATPPGSNTGFGALTGDDNCFTKGPLLRHAISSDGSRAIWSYGGSFEGSPNPLFARVGATQQTFQLDAIQGGSAVHGGEGGFGDASLDGSRVFFTDPNRLTPGSTASGSARDLYRYDFGEPEGERLSDLTAPSPIEIENSQANVQGVIGASADGSYVYFVAAGVLSGEEENAAHEKAQLGGHNLYAWHEGEGVRFIATLAPGLSDSSDWSSDLTQQSARVTPDGHHLAFLSTKSLTGYDNTELSKQACGQPSLAGEPCPEAYLYDFQGRALACASCNPSGARPLGPSSLLGWSAPYEQPRYLSDNGGRLFFESVDALDLRDSNGKRDVYEFEKQGEGSCEAKSPTFSSASGGCLYLLSSGTDSDESYFIDASSDGRDAFIATRQSLFPADEDERFDVYDVRAKGGFPYQPPVKCEGEACRGAGTSAGPAFLPGTSSLIAPPEPTETRCKKGFARKRGSCVKQHHNRKPHKRKHHRRADTNRRAAL